MKKSLVIVVFLLGSLSFLLGICPFFGGKVTGWNSGLASDSHCKAWWKFNDGALTTDSKGTYTLTSYGTPTADTSDYKEGNASVDVYDGDGDYFKRVGTTNDFNWATTEDLTITCWVKTDSSPNAGIIFYKFSTGKICCKVEYAYNSTIHFDTGYNNGDSWQYASHDSTLTDGNWYFVGVTYEQSTRNYRIHILDNSLNLVGTDKTGTWSNDVTFNEDGNIYISMSGTSGLDGRIDELTVHDRVLSVSDMDEIAAGTY